MSFRNPSERDTGISPLPIALLLLGLVLVISNMFSVQVTSLVADVERAAVSMLGR